MFASLHTAQLAHRRVQKGGTFARFVTALNLGLAARSQRRALARLDDAALSDIGVTRRQAAAEARRPVWDVPATWRC